MLDDWIGYLEHEDPRQLGVFDANVGKGGCTIFAQMVYERWGVNFLGWPWCTTFVFAVHPEAEKLGPPCLGARTLARRMLLTGRWRGRHYVPKPGDLIFCRNHWWERIGHVGIVIEADGETVTSIDGNTVDPSGVFDRLDGGAVARRVRRRDDPKIVGYAEIITGGMINGRFT